MNRHCVIIYGETCAGKSTVGKHLGGALGCPYISFGDLKREAIAAGTETGLAIQRLLDEGLPIRAELGYAVIEDAMRDTLNVISGYPISATEFETLSIHAPVVGVITLSVDEQTLVRRFGLRRECPRCHMPGSVGDQCLVHGIPMIQREDGSAEQLIVRRQLYQRRIGPFLESRQIVDLPHLRIDTSKLTKLEVANLAEHWLRSLIAAGGAS